MTVEYDSKDGNCICRICGNLRIWEAAETWQQILPLLTAPEPLALDFGSVESCDGTGVQIVCQILQYANSEQKQITFCKVSPPLLSALRQAGLDAEDILTIKGDQ